MRRSVNSGARAAFATLLLAAPVVAADWLQTGHDAGGTGHAAFAPPAWPDVALRVPLGAAAGFGRVTSEAVASLVVADGVAYAGVLSANGTGSAVVRVPLASGIADPWPVRGWIGGLASDGITLFAGESGAVAAFELATGERRWTSPIAAADDATLPLAGGLVCPELRATENEVVAGCLDRLDAALVIVGLDKATGEVRWRWTADSAGTETDPFGAANSGFGVGERAVAPVYVLDGLSVGAKKAFFTIRKEASSETEPSASCSAGSNHFALDLESNRARQLTTANSALNNRFGGPCLRYPPPLVTEGRAWMAAIFALHSMEETDSDLDGPGGRAFQWDQPSLAGSSLAYDGSRLYVPVGSTLLALEPDLSSRVWQLDLAPGETWVRGPTVVAGDRLHAQSSAGLLYSVRTDGGAVAWTFPGRFLALAAAEGVLVGVTPERDLVVLGDTPYSLRPTVAPANVYAAPGEEVRLDLASSAASPLGPATAFRVEWGDGTIGEWQENPVFAHRYAAPGDRVARAYARNDAGQVGSVPVTFHVGQLDPAVTIWSDPFHREFQETTFFLLGLAATAAVAGVGIWRAGRKRRRFHRELRDLEADHARLAADARACDAMLARRRSAARALFLERRIEEAHASFLVARADELRRDLRLDAAERRLKFLPYGMVLHLQRVLQDARVDEYERDHFLAALDALEVLTPAQKDEVRRAIDEWFARDGDGT